MSVNNVMTKDVISVHSSDKVKDAWLVMMEADISGAPVMNDAGDFVGILSVTDINRAILDKVERARALREATVTSSDPEAADKEELRELSLAIRAVAESQVGFVLPKDQKVHSLSPEDSLDRAIHLMAENNINRLPVVHDGKIVGIITRQDVILVVAGKSK